MEATAFLPACIAPALHMRRLLAALRFRRNCRLLPSCIHTAALRAIGRLLCGFFSAAAFSAASLHSENKYFNYNASANLFSSDGAWSLNEDLSAGGDTTAPTAEDTAIFYKAKPTSWASIYVSREDTAVGNIIASGGGNIAYNNSALNYGTLNFTVDGKIMVQFCDTYGAMGSAHLLTPRGKAASISR